MLGAKCENSKRIYAILSAACHDSRTCRDMCGLAVCSIRFDLIRYAIDIVRVLYMSTCQLPVWVLLN